MSVKLGAAIREVAVAVNERFGPLVPRPIRRRAFHVLFPRGAARPMTLNIDIVGTCNLRCPSCPVGNTGPLNPSGLMDIALFERILDKATSDYGLKSVCLYNWTEPLLHPQLPSFIRAVKSRRLLCTVSSNLNLLRNADDIFAARPDDFRISLSGFTQEVYGVTHANGDIEKVKANMRQMAEARRRSGSRRTRVHVFFHKYRHNLHEVEPMRQYAESLGFDWMEDWAYYMPVEKVLALVDGVVPDDERRFVEQQFAVPVVEAVRVARAFTERRCTLLEDQITLNVHGQVGLCCGVYDFNKFGLGAFLDLAPDALDALKHEHPMCTRCFGSGVQAYTNAYANPELHARFAALAERSVGTTAGSTGVRHDGGTS